MAKNKANKKKSVETTSFAARAAEIASGRRPALRQRSTISDNTVFRPKRKKK